MRGKRELHTRRRLWKSLLLSAVLLLGLTVVTPWSPTADLLLASRAAAAVSPAADSGAELSVSAAAPAQPAAPQSAPDGPEGVPEEDPESEEPPVLSDEELFSSAAFVGDSRTEGFQLYSGLKEGAYFCAVGATVQSVMEKPTQDGPGGKEPILDALARGSYDRIYIMLGVNELGWYRTEDFTQQYERVIDRVQADHPEARIAIESLLPVSAAQDKKRSYVNNERIRLFNGLLEELAEETGCVFLDPASAVADESGTLPAEWTADGVHLNSAGCRKWLEYLRENPF